MRVEVSPLFQGRHSTVQFEKKQQTILKFTSARRVGGIVWWRPILLPFGIIISFFSSSSSSLPSLFCQTLSWLSYFSLSDCFSLLLFLAFSPPRKLNDAERRVALPSLGRLVLVPRLFLVFFLSFCFSPLLFCSVPFSFSILILFSSQTVAKVLDVIDLQALAFCVAVCLVSSFLHWPRNKSKRKIEKN